MAISRSAWGLTTGEISAHSAEVYGAAISKDAIAGSPTGWSRRCSGWVARPLLPIYAAVCIDAIVRHEALCYRVEVVDLHRQVVAAAGLKLEAA